MKRSVSAAAALLSVAFTLPVWAQDPAAETTEPTAETSEAGTSSEAAVTEAPADETTGGEAEAAPAEAGGEPPAEAGAETGEMATEAVSEEAPSEEAPSEEPPSEEALSEEAPSEEVAAEEPGEPFHLYAGVDYANITLSISDEAREAQFGGRNPRSEIYRLRAGTRLFGAIGLEAHYGIAESEGDEDDKYEVAEYYGAFLVPTGTLFDLVEISVPVGYSVFKAQRGSATTQLDGVSYGMNIELPITIGAEWLPDVRIGGGGLVYQAHDDTRVYGYHVGLRADFKL